MDQIGTPDGGAGDATGDTGVPGRAPDPLDPAGPGVESIEAEPVKGLDAIEAEPVEAIEAIDAPTGDDAPAAPTPASKAGRALGYVAAAIAGGAIVLLALVASGRVGSAAEPVASPSPSPSASAGTAAPVLGDPSAPVLVEIWADYQCPYCGVLTHAMEGTLLRDYVDTGRIRLAYRDFAFLGQESLEAAAAARCAGQQGGYWRYHDLLFASQQGENQGAFAAQNLIGLAGFAGLDRDVFTTCMNSSDVRADVAADTEAGRALGVGSTPSVNVVGPKGTTLLKGLPGFAGLDAAIEEVTTGVKPSPSPSPSPSAGASAAPATSPSPAASGASPAP